ncbi:MAG: methionyl-tRNA formyltransferase [Steroidobacteraceae bacterium]
MSQNLNIAFAGTPAFAVPALESLLRSRHRVVTVYTQPDRPAGRGRQLQVSPVKDCALRHDIPVEQPLTLRDDSARERLASCQVDVMVVVAYGLILPPAVLATPRLGCLNIHASLLPRWRGAAPIQRALLAGDRQTGVDIMRMEEGLDTGPVFIERIIDIGLRDTAGSLHDKLAALGADALLEALEGLITGTLQPRPQTEAGVTYARKIMKEEAVIDWSKPALEIDRLIRAFNPVPGAETVWRGQQLKVWQAEATHLDGGNAPGAVVSADGEGIVVAAGSGAVRLLRIQLPGRKATTAGDFLNAHRIAGDRLGRDLPDHGSRH